MTTAPTLAPEDIAALNARFEPADPRQIVQWAVETYGDGLSVGASFGGASGMAILHMVAQLKPNVHVFVIDTDYLFEETHETMRQSVPALRLENVNVYKSRLTHEEQAKQYGSALWMRDPDLCCEIRKIEPLRRALADKDAWITGLRREQAVTRGSIESLHWDDAHGLMKANPLAEWHEGEVWAYLRYREVPYNALHDRGSALDIDSSSPSLPGDLTGDDDSGRPSGF